LQYLTAFNVLIPILESGLSHKAQAELINDWSIFASFKDTLSFTTETFTDGKVLYELRRDSRKDFSAGVGLSGLQFEKLLCQAIFHTIDD
jgi:hypothetical protein